MALQQRGKSARTPGLARGGGNSAGTDGDADDRGRTRGTFRPSGTKQGYSGTPVPSGAPNSMTTDDTPLITGGTVLRSETKVDLDGSRLGRDATSSSAQPRVSSTGSPFGNASGSGRRRRGR